MINTPNLTPQEMRICYLIKFGYSNLFIAKELFIQPKTLDNHLISIYRKFDVPKSRNVSKRVWLVNQINMKVFKNHDTTLIQ